MSYQQPLLISCRMARLTHTALLLFTASCVVIAATANASDPLKLGRCRTEECKTAEALFERCQVAPAPTRSRGYQGRSWYDCGECNAECGFYPTHPVQEVRWDISEKGQGYDCDFGDDAHVVRATDVDTPCAGHITCGQLCAAYVLGDLGVRQFPMWAVASADGTCKCARPATNSTGRSCAHGSPLLKKDARMTVWRGSSVADGAGLAEDTLRTRVRFSTWTYLLIRDESTLLNSLSGMRCTGYFSSKAEETYTRAVAEECVQDWRGQNSSVMFFPWKGRCAMMHGHIKMIEDHIAGGIPSYFHARDEFRSIKSVQELYVQVPQFDNARRVPSAGKLQTDAMRALGSSQCGVLPQFEGIFPRLEHVVARLHITAVGLTSLRGFERLQSVGGDVKFDLAGKEGSLKSFEGFNNLQTVGGNFDIVDTAVDSFDGFDSLRDIGGSLRIIQSALGASGQAKAPFASWSNLARVGGDVYFLQIVNLNTFAGLRLKKIGGCLVIESVDVPAGDVAAFDTFRSLESVGTALTPAPVSYIPRDRVSVALLDQCRSDNTPIILAWAVDALSPFSFTFPATVRMSTRDLGIGVHHRVSSVRAQCGAGERVHLPARTMLLKNCIQTKYTGREQVAGTAAGVDAHVYAIGLNTTCEACADGQHQPNAAHIEGSCHGNTECAAEEDTAPTLASDRTCRAVPKETCATRPWLMSTTQDLEQVCAPSLVMCYAASCYRYQDQGGPAETTSEQIQTLTSLPCQRVSIKHGTCTEVPGFHTFLKSVMLGANEMLHVGTSAFSIVTGGFIEIVQPGSSTILGDRTKLRWEEGMPVIDPNISFFLKTVVHTDMHGEFEFELVYYTNPGCTGDGGFDVQLGTSGNSNTFTRHAVHIKSQMLSLSKMNQGLREGRPQCYDSTFNSPTFNILTVAMGTLGVQSNSPRFSLSWVDPRDTSASKSQMIMLLPLQNGAKNHDLRCVLHPSTLRCWVQNTCQPHGRKRALTPILFCEWDFRPLTSSHRKSSAQPQLNYQRGRGARGSMRSS